MGRIKKKMNIKQNFDTNTVDDIYRNLSVLEMDENIDEEKVNKGVDSLSKLFIDTFKITFNEKKTPMLHLITKGRIKKAMVWAQLQKSMSKFP